MDKVILLFLTLLGFALQSCGEDTESLQASGIKASSGASIEVYLKQFDKNKGDLAYKKEDFESCIRAGSYQIDKAQLYLGLVKQSYTCIDSSPLSLIDISDDIGGVSLISVALAAKSIDPTESLEDLIKPSAHEVATRASSITESYAAILDIINPPLSALEATDQVDFSVGVSSAFAILSKDNPEALASIAKTTLEKANTQLSETVLNELAGRFVKTVLESDAEADRTSRAAILVEAMASASLSSNDLRPGLVEKIAESAIALLSSASIVAAANSLQSAICSGLATASESCSDYAASLDAGFTNSGALSESQISGLDAPSSGGGADAVSISSASSTVSGEFEVNVVFNGLGISGFAEDDLTVVNGSVKSGSVSIGIEASGSTTFTTTIVPSADGTVSVNVNTDAVEGGNPASALLEVLFDSSAPSFPTVSFTNASDGKINSSPLNASVASLESAAQIKFYLNSTCTGDAAVVGTSSGSTLSVSIPIGSAEEEKSIYAVAVDAHSNESACTSIGNVTLDSTAPSISLASSSIDLSSPENGSYSSNKNPQFSGSGFSADSGNFIVFYVNSCSDSNEIGQAEIDDSGNFNADSNAIPGSIADGIVQFKVKMSDGVNLSSSCEDIELGYTLYTPLELTSNVSNGQDGVTTDTALEFTLEDALDASTVSRKTVLLRRKGTRHYTTGDVTYSSGDKKLTYEPHLTLQALTTYQVMTAPGLKDAEGGDVASVPILEFTTGSVSVSGPSFHTSNSSVPIFGYCTPGSTNLIVNEVSTGSDVSVSIAVDECAELGYFEFTASLSSNKVYEYEITADSPTNDDTAHALLEVKKCASLTEVSGTTPATDENGVYLITDAAEFAYMNSSSDFRLENDITLDCQTFVKKSSFSGDFDGNGMVIRNYSRNLAGYSGLFYGSGLVHDLIFLDAYGKTGANYFSILGYNQRHFQNLTYSGFLDATSSHDYGGHLAVFNSECVGCNVEVYTANGGSYSGGMVGLNSGTGTNASLIAFSQAAGAVQYTDYSGGVASAGQNLVGIESSISSSTNNYSGAISYDSSRIASDIFFSGAVDANRYGGSFGMSTGSHGAFYNISMQGNLSSDNYFGGILYNTTGALVNIESKLDVIAGSNQIFGIRSPGANTHFANWLIQSTRITDSGSQTFLTSPSLDKTSHLYSQDPDCAIDLAGGGCTLEAGVITLNETEMGKVKDKFWVYNGHNWDRSGSVPTLKKHSCKRIKNYKAETLANLTQTDGKYEITNINELMAISEDMTADYILMNDIHNDDLKHMEACARWTPLGAGDATGASYTAFSGTLDGNNHTISHFLIHKKDYHATNPSGLFAAISTGTVQDLKIEHFFMLGNNASTDEKSGIVAGQIVGDGSTVNISNVWVSQARVLGYDRYTGGIVGHVTDGVLEKVSFQGAMQSDGAGGIAGYVAGDTIISNCYAHSDIIRLTSTSTSAPIGGLIGQWAGGASSSMDKCYTIGYEAFDSGATTIFPTIGTTNNTGTISNVFGYEESCATGGGCDLTDARGKSLKEADMKTQGSYTTFSFDNDWVMDSDLEVPVLR